MNGPAKKLNLLFWSSLLITVSAFGQKTISGKVMDANNQPQPYISILVLNPVDSVFINGVVTDAEGKFKIEEKDPGNYLLNIKNLGSTPYYKNITLNGKDVELGTITLTTDTKLLQEVNVVSTKKLIEFSGDKMVMDLSVSPITSGLNALDLLTKVPGVSVNQQTETVQIAGKTGVQIMIDGRPTNLSGVELANMLKSMKSDEFEKVEVITNPSAKYDAEGTSGIINLKTKSGKSYGTNYTLNLGGGYSYYKKFGSYPKYNEGFSVNLRRKKYTMFLNLNHNRGTDLFWADEKRIFLDKEKNVMEKQHNTELDKGQNHYFSGRLNLDFNLFKNTTFGVSLSSSLFDGNKRSVMEQKIDNSSDINLYAISTYKRRYDYSIYSTVNGHIKHTFDTAGTELLVDIDVMIHNLDFKNTFDVDKFSNTGSQNPFYTVTINSKPITYILRSSFEKQLTKKIKLETGYRSRVFDSKNEYTSNFIEIDSLKYSAFHFFENVNAAYLIVKTNLTSKLDMETGLRAEHTYTEGRNGSNRLISHQNYINLFPSLTLNRKFESLSLSMGYSRRIGRPNSYAFNIFKQFMSPLNYTQGNPTLTAAFNNSFNVSATVKDKYFFDLSYINRKNDYCEYLHPDTLLIPGTNLTGSLLGNMKGKVSWAILKAYVPIQINKIWMVNIQTYGGVNDYNYTLNQEKTKTQQFFWGASCQQNFSFTETFTAEINAWVNSGETSGFQTNRTMGAIDFGISKKIFKKNGTIKLSLQDPFNFCNYYTKLNYDQLAGSGQYNWDNRSVMLSFTYNFGNKDVHVMPWQSKFQEGEAEQKK